MTYLVGLDLGTSSCKLSVYDLGGRKVLGLMGRYSTYFMGGDRVEQDPNEWWGVVKGLLKELARAIGEDLREVRAMCVSGQAPTLIPVDRNGEPLHRALVWSDSRASAEAELLRRVTGAYVLPNNGLARILWFRREEPEVFGKAFKFLNATDWLLYKLTGEFVTDVITATTSLYDYRAMRWSSAYGEVGVDVELLPRVVEPGTVVSSIREDLAEEVGLPKDLAVVAGTIDAYSAMLGAGAVRPGVLAEVLGSSTCLMLASDKACGGSLIPYSRHVVPTLVAVTAPINNGGVVIEWFARTLGLGVNAFVELAMRASPGADGVITVPYILRERLPLVPPNARGGVHGITYGSSREDLARSVIEGTAYCVRLFVEALVKGGCSVESAVAVGGYSRFRSLVKVYADVTQLTHYRVHDINASALGSAVMASKAVGVYRSFEEACSNMVHYVDVVKPDEGLKEVYDRGFNRFVGFLKLSPE